MRRITVLGAFVALGLVGFVWAAALCAVAAAEPQDRWQQVTTFDGRSPWNVTFTDQDHGWLIVWDGLASISRTRDGGRTWQTLPEPVGTLRGIAAVGGSDVWVAGTRFAYPITTAFVMHSKDGGDTWSEYDFPQASYLVPGAIGFADVKNGCVQIGDQLYSTTDGGDSWAVVEGAPIAGKFCFAAAGRGWALATPDRNGYLDLWRTEDAGARWRKLTVPDVYGGFTSMSFVDEDHGFICGQFGRVFATEDGGETWAEQTSLSIYSPVICAQDAERVWAADSNGDIYASPDGCRTWSHQQSHYSGNWEMPRLVVIGERGWLFGPWNARTEMSGLGDMHPPVTSYIPPGIVNTPVDVALSGTDIGSGLVDTWYKVGDATWQKGTTVHVGVPAGPTDLVTVRVASQDAYGNWEQDNSFGVRFDLVGPSPLFGSQTDDPLDVWVRRDTAVEIWAQDNENGSGLREFEVRRGSGAWEGHIEPVVVRTRALKDHSNDGVHRLACRAADMLGNQGPTVEHVVAIDTRKPTAAAGYPARAVSRGIGSLRFKIHDQRPCSLVCRAVITITTLAGRKIGVLAPDAWFKTDRYITVRFTCPLKAGKYKFSVKGVDGAGNRTAKAAWNHLVVSSARGAGEEGGLGVLELRPLSGGVLAGRHAGVAVEL